VLLNTLFKLGILISVGGWRRTLAGAAALAATAVALAVSIAAALATP
jgi:hypothetical protein